MFQTSLAVSTNSLVMGNPQAGLPPAALSQPQFPQTPEVPRVSSPRPGYTRLPESFFRTLFQSQQTPRGFVQTVSRWTLRTAVVAGTEAAATWAAVLSGVVCAVGVPLGAIMDLQNDSLDYRYHLNGQKLRDQLDPELYALMQRKMRDNLEIPRLYVEAMKGGNFHPLKMRLQQIRQQEGHQKAPGISHLPMQEPSAQRNAISLPDGTGELPVRETMYIPEERRREPEKTQPELKVSRTPELDALIDLANDPAIDRKTLGQIIDKIYEFAKDGNPVAMRWILNTNALGSGVRVLLIQHFPEVAFRRLVQGDLFPYERFEELVEDVAINPSSVRLLLYLAHLDYEPALEFLPYLPVSHFIERARQGDNEALAVLALLATFRHPHQGAVDALRAFSTERVITLLERLGAQDERAIERVQRIMWRSGNLDFQPEDPSVDFIH